MNKHVAGLRNESRAWVEVPADDNGDAMIAAMAEAGVDYVFFTSGNGAALGAWKTLPKNYFLPYILLFQTSAFDATETILSASVIVSQGTGVIMSRNSHGV